MKSPINKEAELLFDGDCALCNGAVRFILRYENNQSLKFASLNSTYAQKITSKLFINQQLPDSLILIENGQVFLRSEAVFKIVKHLGGFWKAFLFLNIFPSSWLNALYDLIARNRNRLFGSSTHCGLVSGINSNRFLDMDEPVD